MNQLETKIFDEYKQWINSGNCENCKNYDNELSPNCERIGPVSFFHVGNNMENHDNAQRIVFVGKASWNSHDDVKDDSQVNGVLDLSYVGKGYYNDESSSPPFWNFIRKITKELGLTLDDIAITNLVKCNIYDNETNTSEDITDDHYYEQCIKLFEKEIIALQPTHLIFFTNTGYDHLLRDLSFGHSEISDVNDEDYKKSINKDDGPFQTWWWHRNFSEGKMNMLRTRHPQRAPIELKDAIVEWVKSNKTVQ
ncbi:MAG: hypothetical protein DRN27_04945 [Thermoplasmata archaeon]|nr:MAG: hypothetical protein DRN27_04945 [Thermoplasmata archaeon]